MSLAANLVTAFVAPLVVLLATRGKDDAIARAARTP